MECEPRAKKNRDLKDEIRHRMRDRSGYFRSYLTEKAVLLPRVQTVNTLIPSIFYLKQLKNRLKGSEDTASDHRNFIDNVRRCTEEAYIWAMQKARSPRDGDVIICDFITNLDILLHGKEEELPEFVTNPENELFRQWFQQFKVEELYYPVLDEFSISGRWPICLLDEIESWRREQETKDTITTPAET